MISLRDRVERASPREIVRDLCIDCSHASNNSGMNLSDIIHLRNLTLSYMGKYMAKTGLGATPPCERCDYSQPIVANLIKFLYE